ncbi:hypothetical protein ACHHYP_07640 [Achlya hypogyna]|nr:hypothetical protein ACHHYP_07640 [Achlya hypogyna]
MQWFMKLAIVLSAAAYASACTNVSVEGDATYCIDGPICSGDIYGSCPTASTSASGDCYSHLPSYSGDEDWCYAKENAVCTIVETGEWGCAYPSHHLKKKKAAGKPTAAELNHAIAKKMKKSAHAESCTEVSVEGDATYCIQGAVCGDEGDACPTADTEASSSCRTNLLSCRRSSAPRPP